MKPNSLQAKEPKSPRIIFFGTPEYVLPVLEALKSAGYEIVAVVTQPPKPVGRKKVLIPSRVAQWAENHKIKIFDSKPREIVEQLKEPDAPLAVLAAYGRIVPQEIIDVFPHGILNIHPSLLPKYRGASPVEAAFVAGEKETGVTIIKLDAEMDHGPIVSQILESISPNDTRTTLRERLFKIGAQELVKILPLYLEGRLTPREQDHNKATFTTLMKKEMGFIPPKYVESASKGETLQEQWPIPFVKDLTIHPSPITIHNFIRAASPWPGAFTKLKIKSEKLKILKLLKAHVEDGRLVIDEVQVEGKNPVTWKQFREGYPTAAF